MYGNFYSVEIFLLYYKLLCNKYNLTNIISVLAIPAVISGMMKIQHQATNRYQIRQLVVPCNAMLSFQIKSLKCYAVSFCCLHLYACTDKGLWQRWHFTFLFECACVCVCAQPGPVKHWPTFSRPAFYEERQENCECSRENVTA